MVWGEVISKSSDFLGRKKVPDARVASELLAARLLHLGRGMLAGEMTKELKAFRRRYGKLTVLEATDGKDAVSITV